MAFAEGERVWGLGKTFPRTETAVVKPTLYSKVEIAAMTSIVPPNLATRGVIRNPVGTWRMEDEIPSFEFTISSDQEREIAEPINIFRRAIDVFKRL